MPHDRCRALRCVEAALQFKSSLHLQYAKVALRLQRDLGVNLQGAALAPQLLEEMEPLRARLRCLSAG